MFTSKSDYLEQIKNLKHRRAVAKLQVRSGNHSLRIESGRHCVPKLPESLRICQYCRSNKIENENHFLFHCDRYNTIRQRITSDIVLKYPSFDLLRRPNTVFASAFAACAQGFQRTNLPSIERSFYLLNTRTICVIFLYNLTQCIIDGFSLITKIC